MEFEEFRKAMQDALATVVGPTAEAIIESRTVWQNDGESRTASLLLRFTSDGQTRAMMLGEIGTVTRYGQVEVGVFRFQPEIEWLYVQPVLVAAQDDYELRAVVEVKPPATAPLEEVAE